MGREQDTNMNGKILEARKKINKGGYWVERLPTCARRRTI